MNSKLDILFRIIIGVFFKIKCYIFYFFKINPNRGKKLFSHSLVSLTSYGERVSTSAPYAVFSIMQQSVRPTKIVLWLDKTKWQDDNLPPILKYLKTYGLEVKYCEDARSYTKLIPALEHYPTYNIITVDDDIYYSSHFLEELYSLHIKEPKSICCLHFCILGLDEKKNILPYYKWKEYHVVKEDVLFDTSYIFPQGYGGVLYPPNSFDSDVFDITRAKEMCPTADDIWFYCMSTKTHTKRIFAYNTKSKFYLTDMFRQIIRKDRLNEINVKHADNNEIQMKNVLNYYNINIHE